MAGHREVLGLFTGMRWIGTTAHSGSGTSGNTGSGPVSAPWTVEQGLASDSERSQQIRVEQIKVLLKHMPVVIGGSYLTFLILFFWVYERVNSSLIVLIFLVMTALTLFRSLILIVHLKIETSVDNVDQRTVILPFYSALAGLFWGFLGFILVSESDPVMSLIVVMVLTGLVASATASLSNLISAFVLFSLFAMVPAAVKFSGFYGAYSWVSFLIFLYLVVSIRFARSNSVSTIQNIELRFANLQLVHDLTDEKSRAESALLVAEQSNHAKSRFLAAASHDLRQPLHALRLLTATLESRYPEPAHQLIVSRMNSSVQSLEGLLDSLLDISRLDAGTIEADYQHFHLDQFLDRVNAEFSALASEKGLQYLASKSELLVICDPLLLERVVRNLLSNAVRYTAQGIVTIGSRVKAGTVYLTVTDTGMGIHENDIERVFEEFVQLDNPERDRSKGLGLGLSIVHRITELLDIDLQIDSSPNSGTTVTLALPEGHSEGVKASHLKIKFPEGSLDQILVVVIDDEEHVRDALEALLLEWNCSVIAIASIDEALQSLAEIDEVPDVILADYRLRNNAVGTDAIQSLHEFYNREIPALVITGDVAKERLQEINECGYPVLHKPCDPAVLYSSLYRFTKPMY